MKKDRENERKKENWKERKKEKKMKEDRENERKKENWKERKKETLRITKLLNSSFGFSKSQAFCV